MRRFYLDVFEDERLAGLDDDGFASTFASGSQAGVNSGPDHDWDPRFCTYLVIDAESLASLAKIPDEPPRLRCANDLEERRRFTSAGEGAWVWLLDTLPRRSSAEEDEHRGRLWV